MIVAIGKQYGEFIIPPGEHKAKGLHAGIHFGIDIMERQVIFTNSCMYLIPGEDQKDINKLFGFSLGWNHHKNSLRFGWRCHRENVKIEIFAYYYQNGKRQFGSLGFCQLNKPYYMAIARAAETNRFYFKVSPLYKPQLPVFYSEPEIDMGNVSNYGYFLYPYFGGNHPATHHTHIHLLKPLSHE